MVYLLIGVSLAMGVIGLAMLLMRIGTAASGGTE